MQGSRENLSLLWGMSVLESVASIGRLMDNPTKCESSCLEIVHTSIRYPWSEGTTFTDFYRFLQIFIYFYQAWHTKS